jgi:hypothetical protein
MCVLLGVKVEKYTNIFYIYKIFGCSIPGQYEWGRTTWWKCENAILQYIQPPLLGKNTGLRMGLERGRGGGGGWRTDGAIREKFLYFFCENRLDKFTIIAVHVIFLLNFLFRENTEKLNEFCAWKPTLTFIHLYAK